MPPLPTDHLAAVLTRAVAAGEGPRAEAFATALRDSVDALLATGTTTPLALDALHTLFGELRPLVQTPADRIGLSLLETRMRSRVLVHAYHQPPQPARAPQ